MLLQYTLDAFLVGFILSAIFGPISVLFIRKTLEMGVKAAIVMGLGVALADAFYGVIAGAGLTIISNFLLEKVVIIKILGGLFWVVLCFTSKITFLLLGLIVFVIFQSLPLVVLVFGQFIQ